MGEKLDFFDKIERGIKIVGWTLWSIPVIVFTLIWIVVSLVIAYLGYSAIFSS